MSELMLPGGPGGEVMDEGLVLSCQLLLACGENHRDLSANCNQTVLRTKV